MGDNIKVFCPKVLSSCTPKGLSSLSRSVLGVSWSSIFRSSCRVHLATIKIYDRNILLCTKQTWMKEGRWKKVLCTERYSWRDSRGDCFNAIHECIRYYWHKEKGWPIGNPGRRRKSSIIDIQTSSRSYGVEIFVVNFHGGHLPGKC